MPELRTVRPAKGTESSAEINQLFTSSQRCLNSGMKRPDGYEKYIKSAKWKRISKDLKKQAGYRCAHCGFSSATLEVHHLTYERFGNERMSDLVVLCKPCHDKADEKRVKERESRGEETRLNHAFGTYMEKKYGPDTILYATSDDHEEFMDWLRNKQESGYYD